MPAKKMTAFKNALIGKTFHDTVADARCEFTVQSCRAGLYKCVATEPYEATRYYSSSQVRAALAMEAMFAKNEKAQLGFWETVPVGSTIHYHNGFGEFVRGEVIEVDGQRKLKPTALVGRWKEHDLPHVRRDGSVEIPYHARKILRPGSDTAWQPNVTCVYEAPDFARRGECQDPRTLPEIPIAIPEPTGEQAELAEMNAARQAAIEALSQADGTSKKAIRESMLQAAALLAEQL